ncbi:zinc finger and SCAN domain-containing protein 12-like isoform X2 [Chelonus insularis]|uniref:zinc finger and SCAN domain-containing protein 12-like isoform X2 n=1 Tax=Chelonus insularis TaxID=460826 RepID=UPI001588D4F2|nr:zinc finger and SCAN domain-containing protein 12-like isoform X2 [Chelonus insularis]
MASKTGAKTTTMEVEELKAILESKDGVMEEIMYTEEGVEIQESDDIQEEEEIVEIIEEIEVVESEEETEEVVEQSKTVSAAETTDGESVDDQNEKVAHRSKKPRLDSDRSTNSQRIFSYDADDDWTLEETDPLEIKSASANQVITNNDKQITMNGNKSSSSKAKGIRQEEDSPHEIVKNVENDLVYTVLGSKKQNESSKHQEDPRYIKMERLEENLGEEEGTIYYEGDEMGNIYVAHAVNDGEEYQYEEQALEQEDQEQIVEQEQWEGQAEEQGQEDDNDQEQIFLHEDENGQLYFKDENGVMQPVYFTEDGNYAIAEPVSDEQDTHEMRVQQKTQEAAIITPHIENDHIRQGSSTSSPTNNDNDNEDNTVTISLIISEDENGLKRTQVIIPTTDALKCEICQKSFKTQFQLLRHNRLKHAREEDITTRNFPCDLCPKRFPDQNTLARHRKTHTGDRPFQCLECQETFPTAPALRRHMSLHNPESKPLPCIYCGRRFVDKPALQKHEESHLAGEQQRGHTCDICHKLFSTSTDLMVHKKNHDPDKKFDCEVCGREFNRLNNLQRHMLVHQQQGQNQEILSCDVCGITYKFMSSLTRHMVTSHMNPEKLRQQAEEQRRKRENNYKRYLENRKMYETQHGPGYPKRSWRSAMNSDPDDDLA